MSEEKNLKPYWDDVLKEKIKYDLIFINEERIICPECDSYKIFKGTKIREDDESYHQEYICDSCGNDFTVYVVID